MLRAKLWLICVIGGNTPNGPSKLRCVATGRDGSRMLPGEKLRTSPANLQLSAIQVKWIAVMWSDGTRVSGRTCRVSESGRFFLNCVRESQVAIQTPAAAPPSPSIDGLVLGFLHKIAYEHKTLWAESIVNRHGRLTRFGVLSREMAHVPDPGGFAL